MFVVANIVVLRVPTALHDPRRKTRCCATSCSPCGGHGCAEQSGGASSCCANAITEAQNLCSEDKGAPCLLNLPTPSPTASPTSGDFDVVEVPALSESEKNELQTESTTRCMAHEVCYTAKQTRIQECSRRRHMERSGVAQVHQNCHYVPALVLQIPSSASATLVDSLTPRPRVILLRKTPFAITCVPPKPQHAAHTMASGTTAREATKTSVSLQ